MVESVHDNIVLNSKCIKDFIALIKPVDD